MPSTNESSLVSTACSPPVSSSTTSCHSHDPLPASSQTHETIEALPDRHQEESGLDQNLIQDTPSSPAHQPPESAQSICAPTTTLSTFHSIDGISHLTLPSLTPSKSIGSSSSSPPDSISDVDEDEDDYSDTSPIDEYHSQLDALSLVDPSPATEAHPPHSTSSATTIPAIRKAQQTRFKGGRLGLCSTPSQSTDVMESVTRSEPGPLRRGIGRKRSVSGLVALRYRSSGRDGDIGEDERGMLALDLDAYINSSDHRDATPSAALSASALFPTLLTNLSSNRANNPTDSERDGKLAQLIAIETLPHRSEWVVGSGTGPGNAHRGFIPGVLSDS